MSNKQNNEYMDKDDRKYWLKQEPEDGKKQVVNLNSVNWIESSAFFNTPAGVVLKSGYTGNCGEEGDKTYTCQIIIRPDDLDPVLYPLDKLSVVKRTFPEGKHNFIDIPHIYYRLFYNPNGPYEKINLTQLVEWLDDYHTFWESAKAIYRDAEETIIAASQIYHVYECYSFNDSRIRVVTDPDGVIIGYLIRNEYCVGDDIDTFVFKDHKTCGEILINYMESISVIFIQGGFSSGLRALFSIPDEDLKVILAHDDFVLQPKYYDHIQYEKNKTTSKFEEVIND